VRPAATVSVDVDPVDLHLLGYGHRGLPPDPLVYVAALPRLVEIFARTGIAATFFVVGRDAEPHAAAIAGLASAGHEVASHTLTHPFAFARLPLDVMRRELGESKRLLDRVSGVPVVGFRSPNFDLDHRVVPVLAEEGFRYDASGYPTPMLLPARLLLAWKSRDLDPVLRLRSWPFTLRREPYVWSARGHSIHEFPVSVTPLLRFPVYHTARYLVDQRRFERTLDGFARRGEPLSYPLHAADALGFDTDPVDPRFRPHPGMELPLSGKLDLLERSLEAIAARFETATFAARLGTAAARRRAS
jgi:peptidoglycan/xylan/chitin deacetylase (PgdA/CDA1 family)